MTSKEFYKLNKGKYFMYGNEKIRVVGYDDRSVIVSRKRGGWAFGPIHNVDRLLLNDGEKGWYVYAEDLMPIAQQEIDLCELLKGCEGIELWCDFCGRCKLEKIHYDYSRPIVIKYNYSKHLFLMKDGKYYTEGKCMLWPSETNRDWSTFKKPVKVLDDDWVACTDGNGVYTVIKYGNISENCEYIIPYDKFRPDLTEEDLKKLSIV